MKYFFEDFDYAPMYLVRQAFPCAAHVSSVGLYVSFRAILFASETGARGSKGVRKGISSARRRPFYPRN